MRKEIFLNDNFYHVYNRGIERRDIFMAKRDYERFVVGLCLFNDSRLRDYDFSKITIRSLASYSLHERKPLVDILHWCLMPNHFHLLLRQRTDKGISAFMHKLSTGFTKYFNKKYDRSGRLFENSFKAKHVEKDDYFIHLGAYISANPLDIYKTGWKDKGISKNEFAECKKFLSEYRWSSLRDYLGKTDLVGVTSKNAFLEILDGTAVDFVAVVDQFLLKGLPQKHEAKLRVFEGNGG